VNRWLTIFHLLFNHLQDIQFYDPDNKVDRFALIFIYYPLLQQSCCQFTRIWNHHKLRTERHQTPIQLYADGNPGSLWMPSSPQELQEYGIDWNGPVSMNSDDDDNGIAVVEPPTNPLHEQD